MKKINIIGIGFRPFDKRAKEIISASIRIILPSHRLVEIFKGYEEYDEVKDRVIVMEVEEIINTINTLFLRQPLSIITILSSGDPLFFGIGRRIISEFGRNMVEILPDLSSIQVAFSRIQEMWDDVFLMSLHGGSDPKRLGYSINDIPSFLIKYNKIAILTDRENTPCVIARILIPLSTHFPIIMYVCEKLGCKDERIREGKPQEFIDLPFAEPNVVIIKNSKFEIQNSNLKKFKATLYVIGVGPGDPELLTLKSLRILSRVPCLYVPIGREEGKSLALSIVSGVLNLAGKEIIPAYFPMRKTRRQEVDKEGSGNLASDQYEIEAKWEKTVESILERINKGMEVAFITLGDPTLYSTFFYLYDRLFELNPGMDIQIIPGVSSINAAASRAGIPLGLANEKIAIIPANYEDNLKEALKQFDTIILMKVYKVFDSIRKTLDAMNLINNAIYISRVGMKNEEVFKNIKDVKAEDLNYFSMIIVKNSQHSQHR
jgi:precorrin-2/cobalt-factor-2 C20-methyltransferase